jgi:hypothetical protein
MILLDFQETVPDQLFLPKVSKRHSFDTKENKEAIQSNTIIPEDWTILHGRVNG